MKRLRLWMLLLFVAMIAVLMSLIVRESRKVFAPDILLVEVIPALPDRPITGSRLVRPDGTISLGYYGCIPVAGSTPDEIRRAVAFNLRRHLPGATVDNVSVSVIKVNHRRPNLVDWITGKTRFQDIETFL